MTSFTAFVYTYITMEATSMWQTNVSIQSFKKFSTLNSGVEEIVT